MESTNDKRKFSAKWSSAIAEHGYTAVPNLLLTGRKQLELTVAEAYVLIAIESFRWDDRDPWPSLDALAHRAGMSVRNVSRCVGQLVSKGFIRRRQRGVMSSVTIVDGIKARLDVLATSSIPYGRKQPPKWDKTRKYPTPNLSTKEDPGNNTQLKDEFINNNGFEKLDFKSKYQTRDLSNPDNLEDPF